MVTRAVVMELHPNDTFIFLDPPNLDKGIIGVARRTTDGPLVVVYQVEELLYALADDMGAEGAVEWYEHNIESAWLGDKTPIYVSVAA